MSEETTPVFMRGIPRALWTEMKVAALRLKMDVRDLAIAAFQEKLERLREDTDHVRDA